jgi:hypothetical protein
MVEALLSLTARHKVQSEHCKYKKIKVDTTHDVLLEMLSLAVPAHQLLTQIGRTRRYNGLCEGCTAEIRTDRV